MAQIIWLDNISREVRYAVRMLREAGHVVHVVESEKHLVERLTAGNIPDLVIQDLHRSPSTDQIPEGMMRSLEDSPWESGWKFYQEVLRPYFPNVRVLICSHDAHKAENLKRADDFNVYVLRKGDDLRNNLLSAVAWLISAQHELVSPRLYTPSIVTVDFERVTQALIDHLSRRPSDLHKINWSTFEKLVARLLQELGYEVEHTPLTRDGGVDIWAVLRTDLGEVQYAIDAKKYAPGKIVGPEPVRAIYGVTQMTGASVGMIVTTVYFGPEAQTLAHQYRYRLALRDYEGVCDWLKRVSNKNKE